MTNWISAVRTLASAPTRSMLLRLVAGGLAAALLGACAANRVTQYNTETQAEPRTQLMWVSLVHDVGFEVGEAKLSDTEKARLDAFLTDINAEPSDSLVIDPGSFRGGIVEPRVGSVADYLNRRLPGVPHSVGHLGWEESDEAFRIIVGRYLVIPPNCPNFEGSSQFNPNNFATSNFGCSNETNLALMVANPADLLHGRPLGAGDGQVLAAAVARYRAGAITPLEFTAGIGGVE